METRPPPPHVDHQKGHLPRPPRVYHQCPPKVGEPFEPFKARNAAVSKPFPTARGAGEPKEERRKKDRRLK